MHKRSLITALICFFAFQGTLSAIPDNNCCGCFTDVEFRVAYFYPTNPLFRRIYNDARIDYELEFTQHLACGLDVWENVSWLPTHGHSIGEHHSTTLNLVPLSAGLKYRFCINPCTTFRLGFGGVYYFLNVHDKSSCACIDSRRDFTSGGLVGKADLRYSFCGCNFVSVFVDYLYLPTERTHGQCDDFGGFKFGAGIGHSF